MGCIKKCHYPPSHGESAAQSWHRLATLPTIIRGLPVLPRRKGGNPVQITGAQLRCIFLFLFLGSLIICQLYKLTLSDQVNTTLQLTVFLIQLKDFSAIPPLLGGGGVWQILSPGPKPALSSPLGFLTRPITSIRPWPLPFKSYITHFSPIILPTRLSVSNSESIVEWTIKMGLRHTHILITHWCSSSFCCAKARCEQKFVWR
jgi:hypothetical protein